MMRVLVACEFSGTVREAFAARGHDAWSCDLLPTEIPGQHIEGDVLEVLDRGWDLMIAHPPCERLCTRSYSWMHKPGYPEHRAAAFAFFMKLYNAPVKKVCVENPVGYMNTHFRKPDQIIQPYYFGERQMKKTCLWMRGLPKLHWYPVGSMFETATLPPEPAFVSPNGQRRYFVDAMPGGKAQAHLRSKTFDVIAAAMAAQWG